MSKEPPPPPCCVYDTANYAIVAGGVQIICSILWLSYSNIIWLAEPFPRVKNSFETYYAFGQPMLSGVMGVGLVIVIITSIDFTKKVMYIACWLALQITLGCITLHHITRFFKNDAYIDVFKNEQRLIQADCFINGLRVILQLYEVIAVISYLVDQYQIAEYDRRGKMEDQNDDGAEDISVSPELYWSLQEQLVIQSRQPIFIGHLQPFISMQGPGSSESGSGGPGPGPASTYYPYPTTPYGQVPHYYYSNNNKIINEEAGVLLVSIMEVPGQDPIGDGDGDGDDGFHQLGF